MERAAYRDIFDFSKTLDELDSQTSGLPQAKENSFRVAQAVIEALKEVAGKDKAA